LGGSNCSVEGGSIVRKAVFRLVALCLAATPLAAQAPDFYRSVDRLIWVVEDVDKTVSALRNVGFTNVADPVEVEIPNGEFRGRMATGSVRISVGRVGDLLCYWFQPLEGSNPYSEFLEKHGSGVLSLMHRVPTMADFDAEVERMTELGAGILAKGTTGGPGGLIHFTFFDTEAEGRYVLGIMHVPEGPGFPPDNPSGRVVTQFAFAVKELEPVSAYWETLGFPAMEITHGKLRDLKYRGQPAEFDMRLGWHRQNKVVYEWIQSLRGPDVYLDHMKVHGEGFHHLAFNVQDMDADIAWWTEKGCPESMSGGWGRKGKPGSGRFAYIDAQSIGGTDIELLWNYQGE